MTRLEEVVTGLKAVQDQLEGGYLSAFPSEHFDRLQSLEGVWAPYYVVCSGDSQVFSKVKLILFCIL